MNALAHEHTCTRCGEVVGCDRPECVGQPWAACASSCGGRAIDDPSRQRQHLRVVTPRRGYHRASQA
jgi:hypothetical protein